MRSEFPSHAFAEQIFAPSSEALRMAAGVRTAQSKCRAAAKYMGIKALAEPLVMRIAASARCRAY